MDMKHEFSGKIRIFSVIFGISVGTFHNFRKSFENVLESFFSTLENLGKSSKFDIFANRLFVFFY